MGGVALLRTAPAIIARGAEVTAQAMQVQRGRVCVEVGAYLVTGSDARMSFGAVAAAAPQALGECLAETLRYTRERRFDTRRWTIAGA